MTASEYRQHLAALGLTQAGAAAVLGIHLRTSQAYAGGRPIPKAIELALTGLAAKARANPANWQVVESWYIDGHGNKIDTTPRSEENGK